MSVGWSGPDPTGFTDNATDYELGTKYHANSDITINNVRVWSPAGSVAFASRKGRIWSAAGVLQATANLPDQLPSGWSTYALSAPVTVVAGTDIWASYSVQDTYGAVTAPGYPRTSGDGLVAATGGALNGAPTAFPNSAQATFYGIDIDYTAGLAGNQRPVVGITATPTGYLTASATLTITDDFPATVTYVIEWGDGTSSGVNTLGPHQHVYAAAGTYAVMVTATDAGGLTDSAALALTVHAPTPNPLLTAGTAEFIAAAPVLIALRPKVETKTAAGGKVRENGASRAAQTFRLIPQNSASANNPGVVRNADGVQRKATHVLLGMPDAVMAVGDTWTVGSVRYEILEILPDNGYERRARVMANG